MATHTHHTDDISAYTHHTDDRRIHIDGTPIMILEFNLATIGPTPRHDANQVSLFKTHGPTFLHFWTANTWRMARGFEKCGHANGDAGLS